MEINFCEYLMNIGLINKESFTNLILEYHKTYSNKDNNFAATMESILKNFLENLSEAEKNYMSSKLVELYLQYMKNKKICRLKVIYMIYKGKEALMKYKYLYRWKSMLPLQKSRNGSSADFINNTDVVNSQKKMMLNKKIKKRKDRNERKEIDKFQSNFTSMKINGNSKYTEKFQILFAQYNKKKHPISAQNESSTKKHDSTKENSIKKNNKVSLSEFQTSLALKEQKELMECTFIPKINNSSKRKNIETFDDSIINKKKCDESSSKRNSCKDNKNVSYEIFEKLHNDKIFYKNKINMSKEKYDINFKKENTFKPKIYSNSFNLKYAKKSKSFNERQKLFIEKKEKNSEKMKKLMDENWAQLCPFVPEVNIVQSSNNPKNDIENENDQKKYNTTRLQNKTNSPFARLYEDSLNRNLRQMERQKNYDDYIACMANIINKNTNSVDYEKLNELYANKKKKDIIKKIKKKVEDEEGITFKPDIYINECIKNVNSDFFERNQKFLKDKQNFIENSAKERNKLYTKAKFTKEERKEIVKNIVKRLASENNNNN